ncbi:MAG TPA: hypothetical protein VHD87_03955, partial [Acidimicrobiales bacterium]|nr:hypothetical protein [Acidimicrobiales bacterium]
RARATGQTSRASFGGSSAVHLELKPSLPAGDYTVVLLCADNTQASVPHTRLPAGAPAPDPQAPASVVSSGGTGTPPTSADGTVLTTIPAPQLDTDHIRSVAAKDAAQLREQHTSSGSPVLPITAAGVATFGGIGALWFVHRRRALTAAKALIATP